LSWLSQKNVLCVGGSWIAPKNDNNYDKIKKRALEVLNN
jgi:2-keto-3-deoxy-6-phosphogluconate aldolase